MHKKIVLIAVTAALTAMAALFALNAPAVRADGAGVETADALQAARRMERLCCGIVSGSDISMEKSAFNCDFAPREPVYVERFRDYSGPSADFVPVLMYHFFYDATKEKPKKGSNSHSIQSVEAQLQWLWEHDYVTLSMDELYEWLEGNIEVPAKCVVLTSDDGQDNFFDILQPALHKYGFVATSFVITGWRKNIPYKLTLPNIELHSHTHNMHRGTVASGGVPDNRGMMQGVSVEEGLKDINKSVKILGGSRYFAYPYGTYGGNSKEILRQAGIRLAFTTRPGLVRRGDDPLQLRRLRMSGNMTAKGFSYTVRYDEAKKKYK